DEFPLPEQLPTANEDKFPLLIQSDATAEELCAGAEVIEFEDSYEAPKADAATVSASDGSAKKKGRTVAVTTDDMQKRRNERYGNFTAEGSETLEQTFNRLQVTVSQLEFMDIEIKKDDLNQKFLTNLAPEWLMHTIVWRNRSDLDTMSLDDLYNHLKVYESEVQKKSNSNSQNIAFISSAKHNSGNEEVYTASVSTASTNVSLASANIEAASISQETACAYIASQSNEEQTPKALMEIDGVGWDWSFMRNEQEDHALVADEVPTEFALMAKTSDESEVFDNSLCSKNCKKNTESLNNKITDLDDKLFDSKNMMFHYKAGLAQVEGRLAEFKKQEIKFCETIRGLELQVGFKNYRIESLTNELELLKKEKGELETKLTGFQSASKDLESLLESQRLDKNKEGLGYSVVPPPPAQVYSPPKKDMSWNP
nr:hypothetical protein [Tanacetum cinerariifolium]